MSIKTNVRFTNRARPDVIRALLPYEAEPRHSAWAGFFRVEVGIDESGSYPIVAFVHPSMAHCLGAHERRLIYQPEGVRSTGLLVDVIAEASPHEDDQEAFGELYIDMVEGLMMQAYLEWNSRDQQWFLHIDTSVSVPSKDDGRRPRPEVDPDTDIPF